MRFIEAAGNKICQKFLRKVVCVMFKKFVSVLLCCVMLFTVPLAASAQEPEVSTDEVYEVVPFYEHATQVNAYLTEDGIGIYCHADFRGTSDVTMVWVRVKLQKKFLWWWNEVESADELIQGQVINKQFPFMNDGNGTYRAEVEFAIYNGSGTVVERPTVYTGELVFSE